MKNKRQIILTSLIALVIVLITVGVTYAFFTYKANGTTVSTITSGGITFHYKEMSGIGRGISITDALPVASNSAAKASNKTFDFKIKSTTTATTDIPFTVTARMSDNSDSIMGNIIDMYLTTVSNNIETPTDLFDNLDANDNPIYVKYNELSQYTPEHTYTEKVIYTGTAYRNYEQDFKLRMWIDEGINLNTGNGTSNYNNKTFSVTINVYASGNILTEEDMNLKKSTSLTTLSINNETSLYQNGVANYTTTTTDNSITLNIVPNNTNATVDIIKTDSTYTNPIVMNNNGIKPISAVNRTYALTDGENYFKIVVTPEDTNEQSQEYHLQVTKLISLKEQILAENTEIKTNPTLTSATSTNGENGLYEMTTSNGYGGTGTKTYFFRGDVTNNVVIFANQKWRIVRINEDGTIRLILDKGINDNELYKLKDNNSDYRGMYYSYGKNYTITELTSWYNNNIVGADREKVVTGNYFCEAARVKSDSSFTSGNVSMAMYNNYTPSLECPEDRNGFGYINSSIGLLTYDEVVLAGAYYNVSNQTYYLYKGIDGNNNYDWWTMTPAGRANNPGVCDWYLNGGSTLKGYFVDRTYAIRPVINIKGTAGIIIDSNGYYVVQ